MNSHYRNSLVFSYDSLDIAKNALTKLKSRVLAINASGDINLEQKKYYHDKFAEALGNDLNTALMLTVLYDLVKDDTVNGNTKINLISEFDQVLSLDLLKSDVKDLSDDLKNEIIRKIEERKEAKKNKDFAKADLIRDELLNKGVKIIDTRDGTTYELL